MRAAALLNGLTRERGGTVASVAEAHVTCSSVPATHTGAVAGGWAEEANGKAPMIEEQMGRGPSVASLRTAAQSRGTGVQCT